MEQIKTILNSRRNQLLKLREEKEKALRDAPEGFLRIGGHGKKLQYYHRTDPKDFTGKYIREQDFPLARELAQKDYNLKIVRSADQEIKAIDKYLALAPAKPVESVYEAMTPRRQRLITPIQYSQKQFVENWTNLKYEGKSFTENVPELYTSKGERVRSKSEIIIADLLEREGIPYRYEYPITLAGYGRVYPDFTVLHTRLRKQLYWEHLGMMDEPSYVENALQKIATYELNGIFPGEDLILTYETRQNPINPKLVQLMIQHYLH